MKSLTVALLAAALCAAVAGCAKPCEKLADEVCAGLANDRLCASYRTQLAAAGTGDAAQDTCARKRTIVADIVRDVLKADDIRKALQKSPLAKKIFGAMARSKAAARAADGGAAAVPYPDRPAPTTSTPPPAGAPAAPR